MPIPSDVVLNNLIDKVPFAYGFLIFMGAGIFHLVVKASNTKRKNVKYLIIVFSSLSSVVIIFDFIVKPLLMCR